MRVGWEPQLHPLHPIVQGVPQSLLTAGPRWFNTVSEEETRSVVVCSQEWPWPLSQSTPQASWGSRGRRLSGQLHPFAPILPCRAHLQPPGKLPSLSDWAVEGEVVYPEETSAVFRRKANHRRLRHPSPQRPHRYTQKGSLPERPP